MEVRLEGLIEKIKKKGIEEGKRISQEMINQAKQEADNICQQAKREAEKIIEKAKREAALLQEQAEIAIKQAGRNVVLAVKEQLVQLCDKIFKREIGEFLTPEFMKDLIVEIIKKWDPQKDVVWEVLVNEEDKQKLEELLFFFLKKEAEKEVVVKVNKKVRRGFRIGIRGEDVHYEFSEESIWEALKSLLGERVIDILCKNG